MSQSGHLYAIKDVQFYEELNHEILLSGHLYAMVLKENLDGLLLNLSQRLNKILSRGAKETSKVRDLNWLKKQIDSCTPIGKKMEYFICLSI